MIRPPLKLSLTSPTHKILRHEFAINGAITECVINSRGYYLAVATFSLSLVFVIPRRNCEDVIISFVS